MSSAEKNPGSLALWDVMVWSVRLYAGNFFPIFMLSMILSLPSILLQIALIVQIPMDNLFGFIFRLVCSLVTILLYLLLIRMVSDIDEENDRPISELVQGVFKAFFPLLLAWILLFFVTIIPFTCIAVIIKIFKALPVVVAMVLLTVALGLLLFIMLACLTFAFFPYHLLLRNERFWQALKNSKRMVMRKFWPVFLSTLLLIVSLIVFMMPFLILVTFCKINEAFIVLILGIVVSVFTPVWTAFYYRLYSLYKE